MGQAISTSQFFVYGKRNFTKTGYLRHVKKYTDPVQSSATIGRNQPGADGVDLENKVVVITGANSGLGKELSTYAAAKGATIYMVCRNQSRGEAARDDIVKQTSANVDNIKVLTADVGELGHVRKLVQELQDREPKIDCLVCNAGALLTERQDTKDGNEITFACHLLGGSYLLSQLLVPQLKKAGSGGTDGNGNDGGRVIFVSSGGMYNQKFPNWDTATCAEGVEYDGFYSYCIAKRGQVLLAEELTKSIPDITWLSVHPGWTTTPGVSSSFGDTAKYLEPMRTLWEGCEGITWLMSTPKSNLQSGSFYLDRQIQTKHIAGPFMTEGTFTKNTSNEIQNMMNNLKQAAGI